MDKNLTLCILGTIILLNLVHAELIIEPVNMEINGIIDEEISFKLNLTNTFDFQIQDIEFSAINLDYNSFILEPNETKIVDFIYESGSPVTTSITSTVSFNYLVDVPQDPQTKNINLTETNGFQPQHITIHEGDTVIWKNNGDVTHTVTSSTFDHNLQVGGTVQKVFNEVGTITYFDSIVFFSGTIEVLNRSTKQPVNNPDFNENIVFDVNIITDPTSLDMEIFDTNYTLEFGDTSEGVLRVINTGNNDAFQVQLTSNNNWISFDENNFTLLNGEENLVTFKIIPLVSQTSETNKTYDIDIKAKGQNTETVTKPIKLHIPYEDIDEFINTPEGAGNLLLLIEQWCRNHQDICNPDPEVIERNVTIIQEPPVPYNFTATDIKTIFTRLQRVEDSNSRTNNDVKQLTDLIQSEFPEIFNALNKTNTLAVESEARRKSFVTVWTVILGFLFIIICIVVFFIYLRKYNITKNARTLQGLR